jgi:hypothetical protein
MRIWSSYICGRERFKDLYKPTGMIRLGGTRLAARGLIVSCRIMLLIRSGINKWWCEQTQPKFNALGI